MREGEQDVDLRAFGAPAAMAAVGPIGRRETSVESDYPVCADFAAKARRVPHLSMRVRNNIAENNASLGRKAATLARGSVQCSPFAIA
jgi:hypothetical protein